MSTVVLPRHRALSHKCCCCAQGIKRCCSATMSATSLTPAFAIVLRMVRVPHVVAPPPRCPPRVLVFHSKWSSSRSHPRLLLFYSECYQCLTLLLRQLAPLPPSIVVILFDSTHLMLPPPPRNLAPPSTSAVVLLRAFNVVAPSSHPPC